MRCVRALTPVRTPNNCKGWDPSMCAPMVMLLCARPAEHPRLDGPDHRAGYHTFVSSHRVRAVSRVLQNSEEEACRIHYAAKMVIGLDGYARVVTCSKPLSDTVNTRGRFFVQNAQGGEHPNKVIRAGYAGVFSSYETPAVGTLHLDSRKHICGEPG